LYGQTTSEGVVISPDESDMPVPSAILEVKSDPLTSGDPVRGVRLPQHVSDGQNTYSDIENYIKEFVNYPIDGLSFYFKGVNNSDFGKGIFYFDSGSGEDQNGKWLKLATDHDNVKHNLTIPDGTIIMYYGNIYKLFNEDGSGIVGTHAEGWYICNGKNGTPDLRGQFLRGTDKGHGLKGTGTLSHTITEENCAQHTHSVNPIEEGNLSHDHQPHKLSPHNHDLKSEYGRRSRYSVKIGRKKMPGDWYDLWDRSQKVKVETHQFDQRQTGSAIFTDSEDIKLDADPSGEKWMKLSGHENAPLENRPAYTVILYIMKNEHKKNFSVQEK